MSRGARCRGTSIRTTSPDKTACLDRDIGGVSGSGRPSQLGSNLARKALFSLEKTAKHYSHKSSISRTSVAQGSTKDAGHPGRLDDPGTQYVRGTQKHQVLVPLNTWWTRFWTHMFFAHTRMGNDQSHRVREPTGAPSPGHGSFSTHTKDISMQYRALLIFVYPFVICIISIYMAKWIYSSIESGAQALHMKTVCALSPSGPLSGLQTSHAYAQWHKSVMDCQDRNKCMEEMINTYAVDETHRNILRQEVSGMSLETSAAFEGVAHKMMTRFCTIEEWRALVAEIAVLPESHFKESFKECIEALDPRDPELVHKVHPFRLKSRQASLFHRADKLSKTIRYRSALLKVLSNMNTKDSAQFGPDEAYVEKILRAEEKRGKLLDIINALPEDEYDRVALTAEAQDLPNDHPALLPDVKRYHIYPRTYTSPGPKILTSSPCDAPPAA